MWTPVRTAFSGTPFCARWLPGGSPGVKLVTSDAHRGLKSAVEAVSQGASWQRCRMHFMRNALSLMPKAAQQMVGATIRTVFAQPDSESAHQQWRRVADGFRARFPKLAEMMDEAEEDMGLTRFCGSPGGALAEDLVQQPAGATQQGGQEEDGGGGDLPERGGGNPTRGGDALRATCGRPLACSDIVTSTLHEL